MDKHEEIELFVTSVLGDMEGNAILGLMDRPGPRGQLNRFYDFRYPERLDLIVEFIESHSNEDTYLSPLIYGNERNDRGLLRRTPENARLSQSVYQDSDTCEPGNFRLRPSIHLQSSTGRYQDFWVLTEPIPAAEAANISHRIAIAHREQGSDPSSWSANKMLRVPHTSNTRHGFPEPVLVEFSGEIYDAMNISGAYDDIEIEEREPIRLPADVSYESEQDLPPYGDALDKLPNDFDLSILTKEHGEGVDRSRMRYRLLCDLFRVPGLTFEDVLSLAWSAPVSRKWKEDPRNIRGLIAEALKAQVEVNYESGDGIEPPEAEEVGFGNEANWTSKDGFPKLLTDEERNSIAGDRNWIARWCDWNRTKLGRAYNGPYVRLNGWSILSAAFSDLGFVPRENGPEGCNLFSMAVGDSGTGKTSSLKLWRVVMNEIFAQDKTWDIGSNFSANALHEALISRDKKTSVMNADEAHGWFKVLVGQPWAEGIFEVLAKYYDGFVPPMLRTGNRELSGKSAETNFLIHLMGTKKGEMSITNVLDKSMFLSGFLARFIWALGDERIMTEESMEETQSNGEYISAGYEPMARQWAAEFANTKKLMQMKHKKKKIGMMMDRDALLRLSRAKWEIVKKYQSHPQWELLDPSIIRLGNNIRRAATLLALEEGCDTVSLRHTLIAIEAGEEWLNGIVVMTQRVSDSQWKRDCDELMLFVSASERVKKEVVVRRFASRRPKEFNEQVQWLIDQGLIREYTQDGSKWIQAKV
jgi:hypothetical protein